MTKEQQKLLFDAEETYFKKENEPEGGFDARAAFHAAIRVGFLLQDKNEIKKARFMAELAQQANAMARVIDVVRNPKYKMHLAEDFSDGINKIWDSWLEFIKKEQNNGII